MANGAAGRALVAFAYGVFFPVCAVMVSVVDCLQDKQLQVMFIGQQVKSRKAGSRSPASRAVRKKASRSNCSNGEQSTAGLM